MELLEVGVVFSDDLGLIIVVLLHVVRFVHHEINSFVSELAQVHGSLGLFPFLQFLGEDAVTENGEFLLPGKHDEVHVCVDLEKVEGPFVVVHEEELVVHCE